MASQHRRCQQGRPGPRTRRRQAVRVVRNDRVHQCQRDPVERLAEHRRRVKLTRPHLEEHVKQSQAGTVSRVPAKSAMHPLFWIAWQPPLRNLDLVVQSRTVSVVRDRTKGADPRWLSTTGEGLRSGDQPMTLFLEAAEA